jgi:hypothetical protein
MVYCSHIDVLVVTFVINSMCICVLIFVHSFKSKLDGVRSTIQPTRSTKGLASASPLTLWQLYHIRDQLFT